MNNKILLVGAGGYCKQIIEIIRHDNLYQEIGIVDKDGSKLTEVLGEKVIGTDFDLQKLFDNGWSNAVITLGSVGETINRRRLYNELKLIGYNFPPLISKSANIAESVIIEEGSIIHQNAIIDANAKIGKFCIINKGSILSHDCNVGDFVHVSPGSILLGNVRIESDTHIGAGSVIREGISVENNTIIGMGSVVVNNISDYKIAFGNPCKVKMEK